MLQRESDNIVLGHRAGNEATNLNLEVGVIIEVASWYVPQ